MQRPLPLSVAIITLNEEHNLPRCLESVRGLAEEVVVVDSGSTDRTLEIARGFGAQCAQEPWAGYVAQKNKALARCTRPWALCLDADEALTPELADAVREALGAGAATAAGYDVNRRTWFLGGWVWHAWYPEWRLRLVRRGPARWTGSDLHEHLETSGATARLSGDLLHYSFRDLRDFFEKTLRYARISGESLAREGRRFRWHYLVLRPPAAFVKRLVLKQGWRDGWRGWIIAGGALVGVFAKYAFLLEKNLTAKAETRPGPNP